MSGKAILVQGLMYGDEAKGATVDFLCRRLPVDLVVRFNGGSQAAHNVVTPEGVHHTFAQFGSGMLAHPRVRTHLSRFMLVDPLTMMNEAEALTEKTHQVWHRTTIDPRCVIITPFHKQLNRLREQVRGDSRHGSCGMGVGVAREWQLKYGGDVLYAEDLQHRDVTLSKLHFLQNLVEREVGWFRAGNEDIGALVNYYYRWATDCATFQTKLPKSDLTVFEGAQGVLLDETHGVAPYNTWTDCTFHNAEKLCAESGIEKEDQLRVGCLRTYLTRHGAGPLLMQRSPKSAPEELHNVTNAWQGEFRVGEFNAVLVRQAIDIVGGVDCLALSHCDATHPSKPSLEEVGSIAPVGITAYGPTADNRAFMPGWGVSA